MTYDILKIVNYNSRKFEFDCSVNAIFLIIYLNILTCFYQQVVIIINIIISIIIFRQKV